MIRMDMVYNVLSREQRLAILHIVPTDLKVILFFLFLGGGIGSPIISYIP